ncbi:SgcJ/EcaC family oxidoreductase [Archangium minus]|uniref:SgcJ/EcaC family oxidoreductase n=1 Tax=Archangium TaxID=47 RepID=UPI0037BE7B0E
MNSEHSAVTSEISADEAAVLELLGQLHDAWGRGDADGFAALFTEDADYVVFDGSHLKGRAAIAESHRPLFERFMKGSRLVGESPSVRFLTPGVAVVHGKGAILMARQKRPSRGRLSVQTLVAVKQEGRWRFTAFQNTRYRPFAQTLLGRLLLLLAPKGPASVASPAIPARARDGASLSR